jgi:hypothetical protein
MSNWRRPTKVPQADPTTMKLTIKLIAFLLVMAAVVLPRGTAHDRVLLLVLEGARGEIVRELARAGHLPTLDKIIAGGVGGDIVATGETSSADGLLERILRVPGGLDTGRPAPRSPLWLPLSREARPFVLSGVPDVEFGEVGNAVLLPGPNASNGFVGMNAGLVVNRRTIEQNAVAWPYSLVQAPLRESAVAAANSGDVQWVRWQDPSGADSRIGAFGVYSLEDDALYLSPIYTRVVDEAMLPAIPRGLLYVGDDPTRVILSSRIADYLPRHAADLANARALAAIAVAESRRWELLVHVDRRIALTEIGTGARPSLGRGTGIDPTGDRPAALVDAYKAADAMVARWLEAGGPRSAVLIVGLTEQPRAQGEPVGWFAVAAVVGDLGSWGPVTVEDLSATLSYLLSFRAGTGGAPLPAIAARFPLRSRFNVRSFVEDRGVVSVDANADALQRLVESLPTR